MISVENSTPAQLEQALYDYCIKSNKLILESVEAKETYDMLRENKGRVFASMILEQEGKSFAERERKAEASNGWKEYLDALNEARKKYSTASASADAWIRCWDTIRSILSSRNTERRMG